jgi:membrane-associated phospholipid phosphatase
MKKEHHSGTRETSNYRSTFFAGYINKLPLRLLLLLGLFAGAIFLFGWIAHEIFDENEIAFDNNVLAFFSTHIVRPRLTPFMKSITYFASGTFLQIIYILLIVAYLIFKKFRRAVEIIAIGLGGYLIGYFMKLAFHRTRPTQPLIGPLHNFSFPSGHATSGFIFYGLISYLVFKSSIPKPYKYLLTTLLILFSLLIGFSRVYLRVHYPSDVIAGFCIGFAWLLLSIFLMERLKKRSAVVHD